MGVFVSIGKLLPPLVDAGILKKGRKQNRNTNQTDKIPVCVFQGLFEPARPCGHYLCGSPG